MNETESNELSKQQLRELLPFYANQSLEVAQMAQVQSGLQRHPEMLTELAWLQGMRKTMQDHPLDPLPDGDLGWSTFAGCIAAQRESKEPRQASAGSAWPEKLRAWLQANFLPVMATAGAALVVQGVVIAALTQHNPSYVVASAPESVWGTSQGVLLHVTIRPTATETQLRETLRRNKANIVRGPTALGIYTLQIESQSDADTEQRDSVFLAERLRREAATIFETVTPVGDR